jgi:hypothetical protein
VKTTIVNSLLACPDAIATMNRTLIACEQSYQDALLELKRAEAARHMQGFEGKTNVEQREAIVLMETMGQREAVRRAKQRRNEAAIDHQRYRDEFDALKAVAALGVA